MFVAVSVFELHLPQSRSLKNKRRVVKGLVDRLHERYRVSVAETDHHDLLQRAEMAIAAVGRSEGELAELMANLRRLIDEEHEAELLGWEPQILEGI